MPIVYMMCGPAASGKTIFIERAFNTQDYAHISYHYLKNRISSLIGNKVSLWEYPEAYALFKAEIIRNIKERVEDECSVVLDFRNLTKETRKKRLDFFYQSYRRIAYVFPNPDEKVKGYHRANETFTPGYYAEIERTIQRFEPPTMEEGFDEIRPWHGGI